MATKFVFSGAAGANTGADWTNAWTSLASSNGVAAGDIVKVHKTHSETTLAANINWSLGTTSNPVRIVCVDKDAADVLATGALVSWSTGVMGPQGNIYTYGMTWRNSAGNLVLTTGTDGFQHHEGGTLAITSGGNIAFGGSRPAFQMTNQNIDLSGASSAATSLDLGITAGRLLWRGGTYTCRSTQTNLLAHSASPQPFRFIGVKFVGTVTNLLLGSTAAGGYYWFDRCVMPAFTNVYGTAPVGCNSRVQIDGVAGTLSAALLCPAQVHDRCGTTKAITTVYRSDGAHDGSQANAYCWNMTTSAISLEFTAALESPPITGWVEAGSQTVTVYVASNTALFDDDVWLEVLSPSEAVTPTAQATFRSTRPAPLATPVVLTTDFISVWTGGGITTQRQITVTINPTVAGPVTVRVCVASNALTVYVDPLLEIG